MPDTQYRSLIQPNQLRDTLDRLAAMHLLLERTLALRAGERARTNLVPYSEGVTGYSLSGATYTANQATAPNGQSTALVLAETAGGTLHTTTLGFASTGQQPTPGQPFTFSLYAKARERTKIRLDLYDYAGVQHYATYDLSAGTASGVSPSGATQASIAYVGDSWWRLSLTAFNMTTGSETPTLRAMLLDDTGASSYSGVSGSGLYLWGWQAEQGTEATPYIYTPGAAVTLLPHATLSRTEMTTASPTAGGTILTSGLPDFLPPVFAVTVDREKILCRRSALNVLTVVQRAAGGTPTEAHATGATLYFDASASGAGLGYLGEILGDGYGVAGLGADRYGVLVTLGQSASTLLEDLSADTLALPVAQDYFGALETNLRDHPLLLDTESDGGLVSAAASLDDYLAYLNDPTTGTRFGWLAPERAARLYWLNSQSYLSPAHVFPESRVLARVSLGLSVSSLTSVLGAGLSRTNGTDPNLYSQGFAAQKIRLRVTKAGTGTVTVTASCAGTTADGVNFGEIGDAGGEAKSFTHATPLPLLEGQSVLLAVNPDAGERVSRVVSVESVTGTGSGGEFVIETVPERPASESYLLPEGLTLHLPLASDLTPLVGTGSATFARASAGTALNPAGRLITYGNNEARFDCESPDNPLAGYLAEAAGTPLNLCWPNNVLTHARWILGTGVGVIDKSADVIDPAGGHDATKITYNGSGIAGEARLYQTIKAPSVNGEVSTSSVWLRTATGTLTLRLRDNLGGTTVCALTPVWRRFQVTSTGNGVNNWQLALWTDAGVNDPFTAYWYSPQAEVGATASSVVSATAGATNRSADLLSYPTASNLSHSACSVSFWVRTPWAGNDGQIHFLLDVPTDADRQRISLVKTAANVLALEVYGNTAGGLKRLAHPLDATNWAPNTWHHVVGTWTSAGPMTLWLDGVSVGTAASSGVWADLVDMGPTAWIGVRYSGIYPVQGVIRSLRAYNRVLTATEISRLYAAG